MEHSFTYKKGALSSVMCGVISKVFAFAVSLLVAFYFGADGRTDIYFYLILICALLNGWLQGININLVLPEFMHIRARRDQSAAVDFANFFLYCYLICAAALILVCCFAPEQILGIISAFSPEQVARAQNFAILGAVYFCSFFIMTYLVSLNESYKLFGIYFLSPLNSALPLLFLIATRKLEALFVGYITAYLIQSVACLYRLNKYAAWHFGFKKVAFGKKFLQDFLANQPNTFAWTALLYTPLMLISSLQTGLVSAVNYCRTITDAPLDILTSKVNAVAKVKLTAEAAQKDLDSVRQTLISSDLALSVILIPVCVFTSFFAADIVELLFMRGNFGPHDVLSTSLFLKAFILAIPLVSLSNNIANMFTGMRIVKELVPPYLSLALLYIGLFILGIKYYGPYSYSALFLALYISNTALNVKTAKKYAPFLGYGAHIRHISFLFLISFLCAAFTKYIFSFYEGCVIVRILINGSFFVLLNFAVLFFCGEVKKIGEILQIKWNLR